MGERRIGITGWRETLREKLQKWSEVCTGHRKDLVRKDRVKVYSIASN